MGSNADHAGTNKIGGAYSTASTYKRTAADEVADTNLFKENLARAAFEDWPNEAGFEGLTEHRGPVELRVKGNIPAWAAGSLYRTGPGACTVEDTKTGTFHILHWFDGLAHTHRFDILAPEGDSSADNGAVRVVYSSRLQSDTFIKQIKDGGRMASKSFAQRSDPCVGMFGKFMAMFYRRGQLHTNVGVTINVNMPGFQDVAQANQTSSQGHRAGASNLFIGTDTDLFAQADPSTMEVTRYVHQAALHPELTGPSAPAHGMRDPETGDYFSFNLELGASPTCRVFQVSAATGKTTILARFQSKPAYIHSFFLSKNYVIICIPVSHYQWNGAKIIWEGTLLDAIAPFDKSEKCCWFIVDRHHGKGVIAQFTSPAAFFFTRPTRSKMMTLATLFRNNKAREFWCDSSKNSDLIGELVRYRFPSSDFHAFQDNQAELPSPEVVLKVKTPHIGDLPTINDGYACRQHRYTYSLVCRGLSTLYDGIAKVDCETKDVLIWSGPRGHSPGEAIFVPRPSTEMGEPTDEDDGVLLSVVLDGVNKTSYLLCLDAKTMAEVGRAECEFAIALNLHGQHVKGRGFGL
ncbi:Torulene dioxygenase [Apiospora rasikravindrae]|uniref:Torulene dioxygenase n=1 Tax=Apiospora rasikravindrae TaxID=990691 RepID=A0ABR1SJQ0_9PEZI